MGSKQFFNFELENSVKLFTQKIWVAYCKEFNQSFPHSGECKFSGDGQKHQKTLSLQPSLQECRPRFELGFGQPMVRVLVKVPFSWKCQTFAS